MPHIRYLSRHEPTSKRANQSLFVSAFMSTPKRLYPTTWGLCVPASGAFLQYQIDSIPFNSIPLSYSRVAGRSRRPRAAFFVPGRRRPPCPWNSPGRPKADPPARTWGGRAGPFPGVPPVTVSASPGGFRTQKYNLDLILE